MDRMYAVVRAYDGAESQYRGFLHVARLWTTRDAAQRDLDGRVRCMSATGVGVYEASLWSVQEWQADA